MLLRNLTENKGVHKGLRISCFYLAAWLFRDTDWGVNPDSDDLTQKFLNDFKITKPEFELFDIDSPNRLNAQEVFREERINRSDFNRIVGTAPDAAVETGGALGSLNIRGVGPADNIEIDAAKRLNLFTGDNGLGKTFIL